MQTYTANTAVLSKSEPPFLFVYPKPTTTAVSICISNKNKPPAMQVCSQIALASSKKTSNVIMSAGSPTAQITKEVSKWTRIV